MTKDDTPHFVTSQGFTCDNDYIAWLKEIKERYQRVRSRIALQANYGALSIYAGLRSVKVTLAASPFRIEACGLKSRRH